MVNESRDSSGEELVKRLASLPIEDVPADLTDRVMGRIAASRTSLLHRVWHQISRTRTVSFRPIYAVSVLLLVCGAFLTGRYMQPDRQYRAEMSPASRQLLPATIEAPEAAYLVGRGLLQSDDNREQALAFLMRASRLEPHNPEFAYWEGVGYWANGDREKERQSYLRGLESDPANIPLLINLGHNYLGEKRYREALDAYRSVLARYPDEPAALYNSGLIYRALGMNSEEISTWRSYLQANRRGTNALRAIKRLNGYGDFVFRAYRVGQHTVIVNQRKLLDGTGSAESQAAELAETAALLAEDDALTLELIVFIDNDLEAARERALSMKAMIAASSGPDVAKRVRPIWLDIPETIEDGAGDSIVRPEGLLLLTHNTTEKGGEVSI